GHGPVIPGDPPDHATQCAPIVERVRRELGTDSHGPATPFGKMKAVARRAPRETSRQGGGTAFKIRTRTADRIGIDHDTGVAEGYVFVVYRGLDGLIIDAGVRHCHADPNEGRNRAALQIQHGIGLTEESRVGEISAAWIGDGRDPHRSLAFGRGCKLLEPAHAGLAETFCIGHDVGLRNRDEIPGTEEVAYLDLVLQRLPRKRTELTGQNILLFIVELHQSTFAPESWTALPHLASSAC